MLTKSRSGLALGFGVLLLTIACNFFLYLWNPVPLQIIRNATFDQFQRLKPRVYQDVPVRIINIDEESLKRFGQWPWPRTRIAELINSLKTAKPAAIAVDIIFSEKDRTSPQSVLDLWRLTAEKRQMLSHLPDHDQVLAETIHNTNTILGFTLTQDEPSLTSPIIKAHFVQIGESILPYLQPFTGIVSSLPMLVTEAAGHGALTFISDADGVIRKAPMLLRHQDRLVPSLFAESLRVAQKADNYTLHSHQDGKGGLIEVGIGHLRVPATQNGETWIHYTQPNNNRYIPAWRVLAGEINPSLLRDKILLIGASAQGLMDLRFSPLGNIIPGIEVHAQALEQILSGVPLIQPYWAETAESLIILLGGLIIGSIALSNSARVSFLAYMFTLSGLWIFAWHAFTDQRLLIDPMLPSLMITLAFVISGIFRHVNSELNQRWVKQAFSRYISPNLVDYLIEHPTELELGGHKRTCSFVFTDLTDFTSLMETLDPDKAVNLLNEYLENMIAIAFSHRGTLDRIVGDAVAIMFSAPVTQADHQRRAVQCALAMQRFASQYSQQLEQQGIAFGQTRIGVHTGDVIVGNFGGKTIFDYRALGDPVNTASRLENANKYLGTQICVSAETLSGCPDILVRPIGRLLVKGKSATLNVFEPIISVNIDEMAMKNYQLAYSLLCAGQPEALAAFREFVAQYPHDQLAAFHLDRLLEGKNDDLIELTQK